MVQGITRASVRYYTISGDSAAINVALLIGVADRAEFVGCIFIGPFVIAAIIVRVYSDLIYVTSLTTIYCLFALLLLHFSSMQRDVLNGLETIVNNFGKKEHVFVSAERL